MYYESADSEIFFVDDDFFSSHLQPFLASPTSFILKINFLSITFNFLKLQGLNWGKNMIVQQFTHSKHYHRMSYTYETCYIRAPYYSLHSC